MGRRKMTTIRVDEDLLIKAHDLGLNVSKVAENALKEMIRRIESPNIPKEPRNSPDTPPKITTGASGGI